MEISRKLGTATEIEFKNTPNDYKAFFRFRLGYEIRKRIFLVLLFPLLITIAAACVPVDWFRLLMIYVVSMVLLLAIFFIPNRIGLAKTLKLIDQHESSENHFKLNLSDEGIHLTKDSKSGMYYWPSIVSYSGNQTVMAILLAGGQFLVIPNRAFAAPQAATNFWGAIRKGMLTQNQSKYNELKKSKPPYLLGLLCLIPMIGGLVGFGLLCYGIFHYKDRWLSIIGASGILFTVGVFSFLTYFSAHSELSTKGFSQLSQMQLNSLMKDVEFYKLENGTYPDNLEQLNQKNVINNINDPLLLRKKSQTNTKFNYEKTENGYYLFSSGADGIPNTADDIYPTLGNGTDSQFGLLREREK